MILEFILFLQQMDQAIGLNLSLGKVYYISSRFQSYIQEYKYKVVFLFSSSMYLCMIKGIFRLISVQKRRRLNDSLIFHHRTKVFYVIDVMFPFQMILYTFIIPI